mmetsp:Transcript_18555/g.48376  ORF Transcript_18555/g.48376 Transcript_18555/m.48376 type:complete len:275 (-) Transcript_18555:257-1081(-)
MAQASRRPQKVDPWDESFFLGGRPASQGSRRTGTAAGRAATKRRETTTRAQTAVGGRGAQPVVVGNVTLSGSRAGGYGTASRSRPSTAPAGYHRDFAKLNKAALRQGLVTAKEQYRYREVDDGLVKTKKPTGRRSRHHVLPGSDHVYGRPSAEPEAIDAVLTLEAGKEWYRTRHEQILADKAHEGKRVKAHKIGKPTTTRTVMLRRRDPSRTQVDSPGFRLGKFDSAQPTVSTFRSEGAREKALRTHARAAALHEGTYFGQGVKRNPAGASRNL